MFKKKPKYYSTERIDAKDATYNLIFGVRSNGKTYALLKKGLENYVKNNKQMALIRRWKEDFVGKRGQAMFDALVANDEIRTLTDGEWSHVVYYASKWYLAKTDEDGNVTKDERPFAYGFALSDVEHDKSTSYPDINLIVFDEFMSRLGYMPDEFVFFMNVISTIIRGRTDVKIYMLGNTVNKYCVYFNEMGLKHVDKMQPGDIDVYTYGESALKVAVEYAEPLQKKKKDDNAYYFAFDNPRLKMITSGAWEVDIYPHLPIKYKPKDKLFEYFLQFNGSTLHCEIIFAEDVVFTYVHRKTTPIRNEQEDIIFTTEAQAGYNYRRNILKPVDALDKKILKFFRDYKVFYQDNEVGEIVRNYLMWCQNKQT